MAACDHCYECDALGICCASSHTSGYQPNAANHAEAEALRTALKQDAEGTRSLAQCICIDVLTPAPPKLLPAASPALLLGAASAEPLSTDSRKERVYAPSTRPIS